MVNWKENLKLYTNFISSLKILKKLKFFLIGFFFDFFEFRFFYSEVFFQKSFKILKKIFLNFEMKKIFELHGKLEGKSEIIDKIGFKFKFFLICQNFFSNLKNAEKCFSVIENFQKFLIFW